MRIKNNSLSLSASRRHLRITTSKSMSNFYYKQKFPVAFLEQLPQTGESAGTFTKEQAKAIAGKFNFLTFLHGVEFKATDTNVYFKGSIPYLQLPCKTRDAFFPKDTGVSCLSDLEQAGFISVDHSYVTMAFSSTGLGKCKGYNLTDKGIKAITETNKRYLDFVLQQKEDLKQARLQSIKEAKREKVAMMDIYVKQYLTVLEALEIDHEGLVAYIKQLEQVSSETFNSYTQIYRNLVSTISTGQLNYNEKTFRYYDPLKNIPKEFYFYISFIKCKYTITIDCRACHPSLLPTLVRIVMTKAGLTIPEELKRDLEACILFFNNPIIDPRHDLALYCCPEECIDNNVPDHIRLSIKTALSIYLNGGNTPYAASIDTFLTARFPLTIAAWKQYILRNQTTNMIGEIEASIFRNPELYKIAHTRNSAKHGHVYITEKHDSITVACTRQIDLDFMLSKFKELAFKQLGYELIFKENEPLTDPMMTPYEMAVASLEKLDEKRKEIAIHNYRRKLTNSPYKSFHNYHRQKQEIIAFIIRHLNSKSMCKQERIKLEALLKQLKGYITDKVKHVFCSGFKYNTSTLEGKREVRQVKQSRWQSILDNPDLIPVYFQPLTT